MIYLIMVRLEKVIYEQAVNGMNRAKAIGAPKKWFYSNPYEHLRRTPTDTKSTTIVSLNLLFSAELWPPSPSFSAKWK